MTQSSPPAPVPDSMTPTQPMTHDSYSDAYISGILSEVKTVAMVGASAKRVRPSFFVLKYLLDKGYQVFPVNPGLAGQEILGRRVYGALEEIDEKIDMVDIFRNAEAAGPITDQAIAIGAKVVWMQLGVRNDEAARRAEAAGLKVVMDRCPKIEYGRLSGEIGWVGVNSRTISSKRPKLAGAGYQHLKITPVRRPVNQTDES